MIASPFRSFVHDTRAVAAVEFALILPVMLALYLGAVEVSTLYTADRKVDTVASSVADLVSRQRGTLSQSSLDDYFMAATSTLTPLGTAGLGQVVSFLQIDEDGNATVVWSSASGDAEAREADSAFPLAASTEINQLARNADGWLVVSEVTYPYQPIVGYIISKTVDLAHTEFFLPRFGEEIGLDPDS